MDSICFGARSIVDLVPGRDMPIDRIVLTSGLAKNNPFLLQIMADVLGPNSARSRIENATCVGAAIHGGRRREHRCEFSRGRRQIWRAEFRRLHSDPERERAYAKIYQRYRNLSANAEVRHSVTARS